MKKAIQIFTAWFNRFFTLDGFDGYNFPENR